MPRWNIFLFWMVVALAGSFSSEAQAIPEFARKYGRTCASCHTHFVPDLNQSGREFKENGYRLGVDEEKASAEREGAGAETPLRMAIPRDLPLSLRIQSSVGVPWSPRASNRNNVDFNMFENVYVASGSSLADRFSYFLSLSVAPSLALHQGAIGFQDLFGEDRVNLRAGRILLFDFLHPAHRSPTGIANPGATLQVGLNPTRLDDAHFGFDVYGRVDPGRRIFYQMGIVQGAQDETGSSDLDGNKDFFGLLQFDLADPYRVGTFGYLGRTQVTDRSRATVVRFTDEFWIAGGSLEGRWGPLAVFGYGLRGEHENARGLGDDTSYWAVRGETALPVSRVLAMLLRYDRVESETLTELEQETLTTHVGLTPLENLRLGLEWNSTWHDFDQSTVSFRFDLAL